MRHPRISARLRTQLRATADALSGLAAAVPVERFQSWGIIAPEFRWGKRSPEQQATQIELKRRHEPTSELLRVLLHNAPEDLASAFRSADDQVRSWLEFEGGWGLSGDPELNEKALRGAFAGLDKILDVLQVTGPAELVAVPDTNSLLASADPGDYRAVLEEQEFTFLLLPTVLGELDALKIEHRNPEVREKARNVITRIKGWRRQGPLAAGVRVDRSITVTAQHSEPQMSRSLSWLDPTSSDDRIVASILSVQAQRPAARVVLVTGDINLQNKADASLIETVEPPQT